MTNGHLDTRVAITVTLGVWPSYGTGGLSYRGWWQLLQCDSVACMLVYEVQGGSARVSLWCVQCARGYYSVYRDKTCDAISTPDMSLMVIAGDNFDL